MSEKKRNKTIYIVLGAITRQRPRMFEELLQSFEKLRLPENTHVTFCFCENNHESTIDPQVDRFVERTGHSTTKLLQPNLGIPFARNSVLEWAAEAGADVLTFVDDDEQVDASWLVELLHELQRNSADLTGGPVYPVSQDPEIGFWQSLNLKSIQHRERRKSLKEAQRVRNGDTNKIMVATNNWMVSLSFVRQHSLRFDESIGQSSGSDSVFCSDLKKKGGKVCWAENAHVFETVPATRLRTSYVFERARDGTLTTFRTRDKIEFGVGVIIDRCFYVFSKTALAVLRLAMAPLNKGQSFPSAIRSMGCAWGGVLSLFGRDSSQYETTHGN